MLCSFLFLLFITSMQTILLKLCTNDFQYYHVTYHINKFNVKIFLQTVCSIGIFNCEKLRAYSKARSFCIFRLRFHKTQDSKDYQ